MVIHHEVKVETWLHFINGISAVHFCKLILYIIKYYA